MEGVVLGDIRAGGPAATSRRPGQYIIVPVQLTAESKAVLDGIRSEFPMAYDQDGVQLFLRRP